MNTRTLAPIYLDNEPVGLQGDPRPQVSKILAASGKRPETFEVRRLLNQSDAEGRPVRPEDVIDRTTQSTTPIYLRSIDKKGQAPQWTGGPGRTINLPSGPRIGGTPTFDQVRQGVSPKLEPHTTPIWLPGTESPRSEGQPPRSDELAGRQVAASQRDARAKPAPDRVKKAKPAVHEDAAYVEEPASESDEDEL